MQSLDSFYETAMRRGHSIEGAPVVIAEWNYNNIFDPTVINTPDDQNWSAGKLYFPPKSVGNSIRPGKTGAFAAFCDEAYTVSEATLGIEGQRFYTVGGTKDSLYTYWVCPTPSASSVVGATGNAETDDLLPDHYAVTRGTLILEYPDYVNTNKLKVTFNLGPVPMDWSVYAHVQGAPGDGYIEIDNPSVNIITGQCELWWNGTTWVEEQQLDEAIFCAVDKIKVEIRAVDTANSRLQIIEIAAGREIDISERIQEYSINLQMDQVDFIHPLGKMCSSDGTITFNNTDLKINEQDEFSDFYGLLSGRCQYRTYVKYNLENYGGEELLMRTGTLFANDFQQVNEYEYQVELWDILKLLQTTKVSAQLFENISIARIVSSILDSVAVDNYNLDAEDFDSSSIIKYFWMSGEENTFEVLSGLCDSTQSAIYVDEFGTIQLLTRESITNEDDDPTWTFRGEKVGDDLPDIITLSKKFNLQANEVTIKYKKMEASTDATDITDQPLTAKVWEASDTVVLRAAPILKTISEDGLNHLPDSQRDIWINSSTVANWPYKGKVNLDGELIEYDGKGYQKWNYAVDPPTVTEILIHNDEEKKKADRETYNSFTSGNTVGGISSDPTKQNRHTGRLFISKRDAADSNRQALHSNYWSYGWMGFRAWMKAAGNPTHAGKYIEPGGPLLFGLEGLKNYKTRPGWSNVQTRWSVNSSILKCDNTPYGAYDPAVLIRDLGDTEYREMGTRIRLNGSGYGGLIFYLSNAVGYDNVNPTLTDPMQATRFYMVSLVATETVESAGRQHNEVYVEVKNGNTTTPLSTIKGDGGQIIGSQGKWQIDKNKWYDLEVVVKDGGGVMDETGAGRTQIEVYIDGQWVDTFVSTDNIRPTSLVGVQTKWSSIAEFESFYATTTSTNARPGYKNDDQFSFESIILPSGTNVTESLNFPPSTDKRAVLSLSTQGTTATIHSLKLKAVNEGKNLAGQNLITVKEMGPITLKPHTEVFIEFDASIVDIKYTSTNKISVCWESTEIRNFPYGIDDWIAPPETSFYDQLKVGFLSSKLDALAYVNPVYPDYWTANSSNYQNRSLFHDDFGAMIREVRDFDVQYDISPAKGVRIYISNEKVRVVDHVYNPVKGIFTLANASHRDEIVNGNEEIDESNSIDHSLMLYGYIIEDKGDKTKVVKDEPSIRRHGPVAIDLDANWIFNELEAESLADWIIDNWSEPMDTIQLEVFSNTFSQIGDKVNIVYVNAGIKTDWIYIVSDKSVTFNDTGLSVTLTVRRVR